jgi:hypothetical protein
MGKNIRGGSSVLLFFTPGLFIHARASSFGYFRKEKNTIINRGKINLRCAETKKFSG